MGGAPLRHGDLLKLLHRAVLSTRSAPIFGAAWRAAYAGAASSCARGLGALPGVDGVVLHRGAARNPEPGVSDLDFVLLRSPLDADAEAAWLTRLSAAKARLRRAFPMLGDIWVAEPDELDFYLRHGGLRAWEDRPGWRALRGSLPTPPSYAGGPDRLRLDAWVWAFTAHAELSRRLFRPGPDLPAKRDADIRKMHADCRRLCRFILNPASAAPDSRPAADLRPPESLWLDSAQALSEASARLASAAEGTSSAEPWPVPADSERSRAALAVLRSSGARAVVLDAPYHSWAVLEDRATPEQLLKAARALAANPSLPGIPLALTASAWALVLQSSYLGAPLGGLDGPASRPGPGLFSGWGPESVGEPRASLARLSAGVRREAAMEAAAWMALWWRGLWADESFGNRFVLYHAHVRCAQLARAMAGRPVPSAWDANLEGPALRFAREEPEACVDGLPRAALAPQHAAEVARSLRRLAEAA